MKLRIGFSPCPNDTFIFDALVNNKIDSEGFEWEVVLEDVQTLNEWAIEGKLDVTKISFATLPLILNHYKALDAGAALGKGVGPLLISKIPLPEAAIKQCVVAIPGQNTTANLLFSLAYPDATNKVFLRYDEIENFVLESASTMENVQALKLGVIIHENRFTYAEKGLVKISDLGELWEKETGFPIPLGGIVMKKTFPAKVQHQVNNLIKKSIEFAFSKYPEVSDFTKQHSQEMSEEVMRQHINLYVNDFSLNLGEQGRQAVQKFLQIHTSINKIPIEANEVFA